LYKINKIGTFCLLTSRFTVLTKKQKKKLQIQQLVYLRAPKHFNIGKSKVKAINYTDIKHYYLNKSMFIYLFLYKLNFYDFKGIVSETTLNCITSIRLNIKHKIL
jgi:hypothetical protein